MYAAVGAAAIGDIGQPSKAGRYDIRGALSNPSTWSYIWFGLSIATIAGLYFGFGGYKGDVAS